MRFPAAALLTVLLVVPAFAGEFSGLVVGVIDGDTIDVLHNGKGDRIRLNGIDCPEKGQAFGQKAKHATSALVFDKEVTIQTHGKDKYGRTIADVLLADGTNVNHELVKEGWCWWYRKYATGNTVLEGLEKNARETKKGLWVDPAPVPPWVFRKRQRGLSVSHDEMSCFPPTMPSTTVEGIPSTPAEPPALATLPVVGNKRSGKYHLPHCSGYSQIYLENRIEFPS